MLYIPKGFDGGNTGLISGKVMVSVGDTKSPIYDEHDNPHKELPEYVQDLHYSALDNSNHGIEIYIKMFGDGGDVNCYQSLDTEDMVKVKSKESAAIKSLSEMGQELFWIMDNEENLYEAFFKCYPGILDDKDFMLAAVRRCGSIISTINHSNHPHFLDLDFVESILNIMDETGHENKKVILSQLHRIPALFRHVSADVDVMRNRIHLLRDELSSTLNAEYSCKPLCS